MSHSFAVVSGVGSCKGEMCLHTIHPCPLQIVQFKNLKSIFLAATRTRLGGATERRRVIFGLACGADRSNIPSSLSTGRKDEVDKTSTTPVAKCVAGNSEGAGRFGRAEDSITWRRGVPPLAAFWLGRRPKWRPFTIIARLLVDAQLL